MYVIKLLFVTYIFCILTGCAGTPGTLKEASYWPTFTSVLIPDGKSIVFGKVHLFLNGKNFKVTPPTDIIISNPDGKYSKWLRANGTQPGFYWQLPANTYEISSIKPLATLLAYIEPTPLSFVVPAVGKAYYLGDLIIDFKGEFGFFLSFRIEGINSIKIVDNYIEAKVDAEEYDSSLVGKIEKSLMIYDNSIKTKDIPLIKRSDSKYKHMMHFGEDLEKIPLPLHMPMM